MNRILAITAKVLSLRFSKEDLQFTRAVLVFGLICTWIVGIGRYWDHPDPHLLQRLGVGSVIYVFVLALLLWLLLLPLRLPDLSYVHLLTLITLTSLPAIFYAIPVERFLPMDAAQTANVWFLGIVAIWRVSIYFRYLRVYLRSSIGTVIIVGLLPLCGIIFALTALNLEKAVFEIMAGLGNTPETSNDDAYAILWLLSIFSVYVGPVFLLCYIVLVATRWINRDKKSTDDQPAS